MEVRALWNAGSFPTATLSATRALCTPFTLPSGGVITLNSSSVVTLAADAVFQPQCTGTIGVTMADVSSNSDLRDPFYASTIPQCFALAATTVIAYMLVIMLFITPRTFLSGGIVVLGRRGFTNGPSGSDAGIGIGGRPWLQKVAALTVAVSLTIASANTFRVAQSQYDIGFMDALALQAQVLNGLELKVIRVVSDTFLWLAQAQTLIRLFPRQREKIIIKWTAFALISLNLIFGILNTFVYSPTNVAKPYNIVEAIPAVSYLFHLALGLLYCAWVLYYGFTKKAYAFYHPRMRNICLVALMAVVSVIVPVVFFVLDISKPDVAGWGDYVRWVGAAAASVVVWEWVERIEALERNDKKDGVLGREVFDGDEMLEVSPSYDYQARRPPRDRGDEDRGGSTTAAVGSAWPAIHRYRPRAKKETAGHEAQVKTVQHAHVAGQLGKPQLPLWPMRPPPAATPVSRADTGSAESTVYAVRYHPIGENREAIPEISIPRETPRTASFDIEAQPNMSSTNMPESEKDVGTKTTLSINPRVDDQGRSRWEIFQKLNPFRRKVDNLPAEVSLHARKKPVPPKNNPSDNKWDVLGRLEDFAAIQADKLRDKTRSTHESAPLPVTRIPAPIRRRNLHEIAEELDGADEVQQTASTNAVETAMASTNLVHNSGGLPSLRPHDTYMPGNLSPVIATHRVSVSPVSPLASTPPQELDRRSAGAVTAPSPIDVRNVVRTPQGSANQPGVSSISRNGNPQGLPVLRIPAPPRRARSDG
jgi:hypothetical protein